MNDLNLTCGEDGYNVPYLDGDPQDVKITCKPCSWNEKPVVEDGVAVCKPCPDPRQYNKEGTCECINDYSPPKAESKELPDVCVPPDPSATLLPINPGTSFYHIFDINGNNIGSCKSIYVDEFLAAEAYRCRDNTNITACQHLANMCIMKLYALSDKTCATYNGLLNLHTQPEEGIDENWRPSFPWITYAVGLDEMKKDLLFTQRIAFHPRNTGAIDRFDFWVARYTANGVFLGIDNLLPSFFLCPKATFEQIRDFSRIGANLRYDCEFDLRDLLTEETIFYELFVMNSNSKLIDVPIRILNPPNPIGVSFVRRFFMFDSMGIGKCESEESFVRFAHSIRLEITLQPDENELIYRPILEVRYDTRTLDSINTGRNIAAFSMRVYVEM